MLQLARTHPIHAKSLSDPVWLHIEGRFDARDLARILNEIRRVLAIGDRTDVMRTGNVMRVRILSSPLNAGLIEQLRASINFGDGLSAMYQQPVSWLDRRSTWRLPGPWRDIDLDTDGFGWLAGAR
jgi:hypothetical protein